MTPAERKRAQRARERAARVDLALEGGDDIDPHPGPGVPEEVPAPKPARRITKRKDTSGVSGKCLMYAPVGTVCKFCGKVHPLP